MDVVQEAFLSLHRHVRQHGQASVVNPAAWLWRVAHNLAIDAIRKRDLEQRDIAAGEAPRRRAWKRGRAAERQAER